MSRVESEIRTRFKTLEELKQAIVLETATDKNTDPALLGTSRVKLASTPVLSTESRDLWNVPSTATRQFLNSDGEYLSIVSSSIQDANGGSGIYILQVIGLDENCNVLAETMILNGTTPVLSSNKFNFVNYASVFKASNSGVTNVGNITISGSTSGNIEGYITAGQGITRSSHIKVPAGYTMLVTKVISNIENASTPSTKGARFSLDTYTPEGTYIELFKWGQQTDGTGLENTDLSFPLKIPERAIIFIKGTALQNNTILNAYYFYLMIRGNYSSTLPL